ncbi:MAG: hypothetical protein ABIO65_08790 [Nitrospiria bacterium]
MTVFHSVDDLAPLLAALSRPPVVLVGLCPQGLAILRSLASHDVPVIVIESDYNRPSARTRYGFKLRCPEMAGGGLIEALDGIRSRSPHRPVLFVTADDVLRRLNAERARIDAWFDVPFPRRELLDGMLDKQELTWMAARQGLTLPWTIAFDVDPEDRGAWARVLDGATFPAILKPSTPLSAFKALRVGSREDIVAAVGRYPEIRRFVLQEWIPGGDERVVFAAYYFDREGRVDAAFCGRKIRQYPSGVGAASSACALDRPDLVEEGLKLFHGLGYRGLASVEFKLAPDGRPYFIEATVGRMDYWVQTAIVNGVDLPALAYRDLTRVAMPAAARQVDRRTWVDADRDWPVFWESWRDPRSSKRSLIRFLVSRKSYALFDWRDLGPFWRSCRPFVRQTLAAVMKRVRPPRSTVEHVLGAHGGLSPIEGEPK